MTTPLPEPSDDPGGTKQRLLAYLDYFRSAITHKLTGLSEDNLRTTLLPSGWTPIQLLNHLVHMERRWLAWGFEGKDVDAPWGDNGLDGRWYVGSEVTLASLVAALEEGGRRTRATVESADLAARGATGGRFEVDPPTLEGILFHVLQEYARHTGHLDVVRELVDGQVGE